MLIAEAPQVLPLAGSPNLVVLGTEVPLGTVYADIVAVEIQDRLSSSTKSIRSLLLGRQT